MKPISDSEIETIARTLCARNGQNPDEKIANDSGELVPRWSLLKQFAMSDIEAFRDSQALAGFAPHLRKIG